MSTSSIPEVNVTVQNIMSNGSSLTSSVGPSSPSTSNIKEAFESSDELSALSWGILIPAIRGQNVFPPLSLVMALLAQSEHPGLYWNQLEVFLQEAGITSSEQILLTDPTVLALVGNMGTRQAIVLRNHAKHLVLPVLGLQGTYQEDENDDRYLTSTPQTGKRQLDLGESIVHSLYKKRKIKSVDQTDPTPKTPTDDFDSCINFRNEDEVLVDEEDGNSDYVDGEDEEGEGAVDEPKYQ